MVICQWQSNPTFDCSVWEMAEPPQSWWHAALWKVFKSFLWKMWIECHSSWTSAEKQAMHVCCASQNVTKPLPPPTSWQANVIALRSNNFGSLSNFNAKQVLYALWTHGHGVGKFAICNPKLQHWTESPQICEIITILINFLSAHWVQSHLALSSDSELTRYFEPCLYQYELLPSLQWVRFTGKITFFLKRAFERSDIFFNLLQNIE